MLTSEKVKNILTEENIVTIVTEGLGSEDPIYDAQGHPIFQTVCHGGDSYKLYYYEETKLFHCYTHCGDSFDLFELVRRALDLPEFADAFRYVVDFFGLKDDGTEEEKEDLTDDWDIFQTIKDFSKTEKVVQEMEPVQENMLEYFTNATPIEWEADHITPEVMQYYEIRLDTAMQKIVIPHRDIAGRLVGIRGRSYDPIELSEGKKYMPVFIEGKMYAHPLGQNLYGIAQNYKTIQKLKKVLICESEKSVLQCASYYGVDNNYCVATCGSSISQAQIDLLLELGVQEAILGFDREFQGDYNSEDTIQYEKKLLRLVQPLTQYFNVYVIMDYNHLTPYKASPSDCGREILEKLLDSKINITTITSD